MKKRKISENVTERLLPVLLLASIGLSFIVGVLWQRVSYLEKGFVAPSQATQIADNTTGTTGNTAPTVTPISLDKIKEVFKKDVVKFGNPNSKVLFIEVADPSCPYCHIAAGLNPELNAELNVQQGGIFKLVEEGGTYVPPVIEMKKLVDQGKAAFAWIYLPGHGNGEMGTKAMYCAFEKGKFWEVHDLLMTKEGYDFMNNTVRNDKSKSQEVADFLKSVIDPNFLKSCLDSGKYDKRLQEDSTLARSLGITATPGFFINTQVFKGAQSFNDMKPVVDAALK